MKKSLIIISLIVITTLGVSVAQYHSTHKSHSAKEEKLTTEEYNQMPSALRKIQRKTDSSKGSINAQDLQIYNNKLEKSLKQLKNKMGERDWKKFQSYSTKRKPVRTMADCINNCKLRNKIFNSGKEVDKKLKRQVLQSRKKEKKKKGLPSPAFSFRDIEKRMTPKEKRQYQELRSNLKDDCEDFCNVSFPHMRKSQGMINIFDTSKRHSH